jgi:Lar family restriction alleviation protein
MFELKPCPFCGCDKISVQYLYFRPYVICEKCHAQIPCYNTYAKAKEAWNRRAYNGDKESV